MDAPKLDGRIIGINWGFKLRPDADVLFWQDERFYRAAAEQMREHTGAYKITRKMTRIPTPYDIKLIGRLDPDQNRIRGLSNDPERVGGSCSGGSAINLAYLFGATQIILLGFDMQRTGPNGNWHRWHSMQAKADDYKDFMPHIVAMAEPLRAAGVEVWNTSLDSALTCFPKRRLEDFL
jgi:hypothetical protein